MQVFYMFGHVLIEFFEGDDVGKIDDEHIYGVVKIVDKLNYSNRHSVLH